jgi:hypothetical protein
VASRLAGHPSEEVAAPVEARIGPRLRLEADRVDGDLRCLGQREDLLVGDARGGVVAVREQDDGAASGGGTGITRAQLLEVDVEGVVEHRGTAGLRAAQRRFESALVGREVLKDRDAVVELDDSGQVRVAQVLDEADAGRLRDRQLLVHGPRAVYQQRQGDRQRIAREESEGLAGAVLEEREVPVGEPGHVLLVAIGHGDIEPDDVDAGLEARRPAHGVGQPKLDNRNAERPRQDDSPASHLRPVACRGCRGPSEEILKPISSRAPDLTASGFSQGS